MKKLRLQQINANRRPLVFVFCIIYLVHIAKINIHVLEQHNQLKLLFYFVAVGPLLGESAVFKNCPLDRTLLNDLKTYVSAADTG